MATIGTLGKIVFSASRKKVNTFDNMKWELSARYANHDRHLKDPLIEFTGRDADKITFSMYFSAFLGINPDKQIKKLQTAERQGTVMRLVIGKKAIGKHKWVIDKLSISPEKHDRKGRLLVAKADVSLIAYSKR